MIHLRLNSSEFTNSLFLYKSSDKRQSHCQIDHSNHGIHSLFYTSLPQISLSPMHLVTALVLIPTTCSAPFTDKCCYQSAWRLLKFKVAILNIHLITRHCYWNLGKMQIWHLWMNLPLWDCPLLEPDLSYYSGQYRPAPSWLL